MELKELVGMLQSENSPKRVIVESKDEFLRVKNVEINKDLIIIHVERMSEK